MAHRVSECVELLQLPPSSIANSLFVSLAASSILLNIFYFVLGLGARMQDVVSLGAAVTALFTTLLSSHLLVLLAGSALWNGAVLLLHGADRRRNSVTPEGFSIDLDTLLIARYALELHFNCVLKSHFSDSLQQCVCGWSVYCGEHGWSTPFSATRPDGFRKRGRSSGISDRNASRAGTASIAQMEGMMIQCLTLQWCD